MWIGNILAFGGTVSEHEVEFLKRHRGIGGIRLMHGWERLGSSYKGLTVPIKNYELPDYFLTNEGYGAVAGRFRTRTEPSLIHNLLNSFNFIDGENVTINMDTDRRYWVVVITFDERKRFQILRAISDLLNVKPLTIAHSRYCGVDNNVLRNYALPARKGQRGIIIGDNYGCIVEGTGKAVSNYSAPISTDLSHGFAKEVIRFFELYRRNYG